VTVADGAELQERLLADHRLVQQHMVGHAAQRVGANRLLPHTHGPLTSGAVTAQGGAVACAGCVRVLGPVSSWPSEGASAGPSL
jgi:hypothetical protein